MCELMAFNFAKPIEAEFSIREFGRRDKENADGWGLAWYPDESVAVIKEAISWQSSEHTRFLETYSAARSSTVIAHVRHLTTGRPVHADTHPFTRELHGLDYCFAHNGTLPHAWDLPLSDFRPVGRTDSEAFFCHLLGVLSGWNKGLACPDNWPRLHRTVQHINQGGKLNFLLTDGKTIVCYHDLGGWKGLHTKQVLVHRDERPRFQDAEVRVKMGSQPVNMGVVVATTPLSRRGWQSLERGEMIVLREGALCFSSHHSEGALAS